MNAIQHSLLLKALTYKATVADLVDATGLTRQTICKQIKALHEQRLIHVWEWEKDSQGRWTVARWAMGDGPDATRPPSVSNAEKQRAYRQRKFDERLRQRRLQQAQQAA